MAQGFTLQQLQAKGYKPASASGGKSGGLTLEQLQQKGFTAQPPQTVAPSASPLFTIPSLSQPVPKMNASPNDTALAAGGKSVYNSAAGLADLIPGMVGGAVNMFKDTLPQIAQLPQNVGKLLQDPNATASAVGSMAKQVPNAAYQTLVPSATRGLLEAGVGAATGAPSEQVTQGLQKAQKGLTEDPVGNILPYIFAAQAGGELLRKPMVNEAALPPELNDTTASLKAQAEAVGQTPNPVDTAMAAVTKPVVAPFKAVAGFTKGLLGGTARFGAAQATGLPPATIDELTQRPELYSKQAMAGVNRQAIGQEVQSAVNANDAALSETGAAYNPIRDSATSIKVDPLFLEEKIISKTGLGYEDGQFTTNGEATIRETRDLAAVQDLYDRWKPVFDKGEMTPNEYLNFRTDVGTKLAKFGRDLGSSSDLKALGNELYGTFNKEYRSQVSGLENLDAGFYQQKTRDAQLTKGLTDKEGNLTPSAIDRIANSGGNTAAKNALSSRLEELSPGITQKVRQLKAIESIENASGLRVTPGRILGAVGGFAKGGPVGAIIETVLTSPELAVPLLRQYGLLTNSAAVQAVLQALQQAAKGVNALPSAAPMPVPLLPLTTMNQKKPSK